MANDFISREAAKKAISRALCDGRNYFLMLDNVPAADVVLRSCYDRILAENDTMREQLASIGKKPGDSMEDVRPVKRGHWIEEDGYQVCSECGEEHEWIDYRAAFCDCCGADMSPQPETEN